MTLLDSNIVYTQNIFNTAIRTDLIGLKADNYDIEIAVINDQKITDSFIKILIYFLFYYLKK